MGKPDFTMILNGCLAGLVAITAPCAWVSGPASIAIGSIAGVLVVLAVLFFDRVHVDDPVGAISVHLVNGVWGTLSVGLFAHPVYGASILGDGRAALIGAQLVGIAAVGIFTFAAALAGWLVVRAAMGIRVSAEEEVEGLDYGEHGNTAYPDFQPVAVHAMSGVGPVGGQRREAAVAGVVEFEKAR